MSKSKNAKVASKNNPTSRSQAQKYFIDGKQIKPVKLIINSKSFFAAEYEESGEILLNTSGSPFSWQQARSLATRA